MIKGNRRTVFLLVFYIIILCSIYVYDLHVRAADSAGRFTQIEGTVDVLRTGAMPAAPVKVGDPIFVKDVVRTKSNSKAEITFVDGNILRISQRSRIDISEYISEETKSNRIIKLQRGKVEANVIERNVRRISLSPQANRFEIHTPCAVTGVRGCIYDTLQLGNYTAVYVTEGTIYVYNPKFPGQVVEVHAGEMVYIYEDSPPSSPFIPSEEQKKLFEYAMGSTPLEPGFGTVITTFSPSLLGYPPGFPGAGTATPCFGNLS